MIKVAVFENLSSGGARNLMISNLKYLNKQKNVQLSIFKSSSKINNFIEYLDYIYWKGFKEAKKTAEIINKKNDILLLYHSWITKTPYILKYINIPTIYICHEGLREFYDPALTRKKTIKSLISDYIRYPLFYIDKHIVQNQQKLILVANSHFSKRILENLYNTKTIVIYPGIRFNKYKKTVKKKNIIISVGAIQKYKGFDFLVDVFSYIPLKKRPELIIVGNGGDRNYIQNIKRKALELNVSLKIYKNISDSELVRLYRQATSFIYSPINEPFGLVVLEAMSLGLPIIADKHGGGYVEVLRNTENILIEQRDPKIWAKKIVEFLELNKTIKDKISIQNTTIAKKYSENNMNKQLFKLINKLYSMYY